MQWELRRALSRTDQRVRAYDVSERAHLDRRFFSVIALLSGFSNQPRQHPLRAEVFDAKRWIHRAFAGAAPGPVLWELQSDQ